MKKILIPFIAMVLFAASSASHAVFCKENDENGSVSRTTQITPSIIYVPANAPEGTIIWQSSPQTVNIYCYAAWIKDTISFWVNPDGVNLGSGVEPAIIYNGRVYTATSGSIPTGNNIGWKPATMRATISYSLAIIRKGPIPSSGSSVIPNYPMFQFDGKKGLNRDKGKNFRNYISGGTFRYTTGGCVLDTVSANKSVGLPSMPIIKTVGAKAGGVDFSIQAVCNNLARSVTFEFFGYADNSDRSQFQNIEKSGAQGIAINLATSDGVTIDPLGGSDSFRTVPAVGGTATLNLRASYIRTSSIVTGGPVSARAYVMVTYN